MKRHWGGPQGSFGGEVGGQWGGSSLSPRASGQVIFGLKQALDTGKRLVVQVRGENAPFVRVINWCGVSLRGVSWQGHHVEGKDDHRQTYEARESIRYHPNARGMWQWYAPKGHWGGAGWVAWSSRVGGGGQNRGWGGTKMTNLMIKKNKSKLYRAWIRP